MDKGRREICSTCGSRGLKEVSTVESDIPIKISSRWYCVACNTVGRSLIEAYDDLNKIVETLTSRCGYCLYYMDDEVCYRSLDTLTYDRFEPCKNFTLDSGGEYCLYCVTGQPHTHPTGIVKYANHRLSVLTKLWEEADNYQLIGRDGKTVRKAGTKVCTGKHACGGCTCGKEDTVEVQHNRRSC